MRSALLFAFVLAGGLGEEAINAFLGFRLEGMSTEIDPFEVPLAGSRVARRAFVKKARAEASVSVAAQRFEFTILP